MNKRCCKGKHDECNGKAWDYKTETIVDCHCACHTKH